MDNKSNLVVAVDVTSQPMDKEQLYNIASQAKENMEADNMIVIADKGYYSAKQFEQCEKADIAAIVSKADHSNAAASEEYSKDMFQYDEDADVYICPQGEELKRRKTRKNSKSKDHSMYANQKACAACSMRKRCTRGKYRTICDQPLQEYARLVDARTVANMELYHRRKQLVEHPFGTIKRAFGYSYFLTRGNANVQTESLLHFLVYNIKRAINVVGINEIVKMTRA